MNALPEFLLRTDVQIRIQALVVEAAEYSALAAAGERPELPQLLLEIPFSVRQYFFIPLTAVRRL